jgi:hypothetical protein
MHYEKNSTNDSPARALVWREIQAIIAIRFVDPVLYSSMVELGRQHIEPGTLKFDSGVAVDDDSIALRRRNVEGYLHAVVFGWCSRCFAPTVTYPDARRLAWPSLDHHESCIDATEAVAVKGPAQAEREPGRRRRVVPA